MKTHVNLIKTLYFSEKKNQKEIAKIVGVSSQYVSKILRTFPEYFTVSKIRRNDRQLQYKANKIQAIVNKRKEVKEQEEATFGYLRLKQAQNAIEMSKKCVG